MQNRDNKHIPEFVNQDSTGAGQTVRRMKFSKEDEEKMAKMTLEEMMEYKSNLIKNGQYIY